MGSFGTPSSCARRVRQALVSRRDPLAGAVSCALWGCRAVASGASGASGASDRGGGHRVSEQHPARLDRLPPDTGVERGDPGGEDVEQRARACASSSWDSPACGARFGSSRSQVAARWMSSASARSRSYWRHWRTVGTGVPLSGSVSSRSGGSRAGPACTTIPDRRHPRRPQAGQPTHSPWSGAVAATRCCRSRGADHRNSTPAPTRTRAQTTVETRDRRRAGHHQSSRPEGRRRDWTGHAGGTQTRRHADGEQDLASRAGTGL
jgi:hypothetical protein